MTAIRRMTGMVLLGWLAIIGFDFFLHAGLLAGIYRRPEPFLLPLETAFRRIPAAYVGFLFLTILTVWLVDRLSIDDWRAGLVFGLTLGAAISAGFVLGLWSVSTVPVDLALGWAIGQTIESAIAGFAAAYAQSHSLRSLGWRVVAFVVVMLIAGIILQNVIPG